MEFEKISERILSDPLLANNFSRINYEVKNNILKEILKSCSAVSIDYLTKTLREKDPLRVENWILNGIGEGYFKVRIDDIDKIVYAQEIRSLENSIYKTVEFSKRTYNNSLAKIGSSVFNRSIEYKELNFEDLKKYSTDKKGAGRLVEDMFMSGQGMFDGDR
jgi:hypothetical protein